jgi:hypothetical protein
MSDGRELKHRHDVGHPDHAAATTEPFTRALQGVLGLAIAATAALVIWAIWIA